MIGLLVAVCAGYGAFLLVTALGFGWRGLGLGPAIGGRSGRRRREVGDWLVQSGLDDVRPAELVAVVAVLAVVGAGLAYSIFGGTVPPIVAGAFTATFPVGAARARRQRRMEAAREAWPRMIEEIRLLATSVGMSIPNALFEVGRRGPVELRPAFAAAQREWLLSTDFARTVEVLKARLADPTADATCETLLVAHVVGGSDISERLTALIEDRVQDLQGRKDARAKQSGVRFARRFVLFVPLGMAVVGLSIGNGRAAYQTPAGQVGVAAGLLALAMCWLWAGRLLRLPEEQRVFAEGAAAEAGT